MASCHKGECAWQVQQKVVSARLPVTEPLHDSDRSGLTLRGVHLLSVYGTIARLTDAARVSGETFVVANQSKPVSSP